MIHDERQKLLSDYASRSRAFSDAVVRLQFLAADGEAFIRALAETGTAHRACEHSRITLNRHLAQGQRSAALQTT
jgi:hypothetical protein